MLVWIATNQECAVAVSLQRRINVFLLSGECSSINLCGKRKKKKRNSELDQKSSNLPGFNKYCQKSVLNFTFLEKLPLNPKGSIPQKTTYGKVIIRKTNCLACYFSVLMSCKMRESIVQCIAEHFTCLNFHVKEMESMLVESPKVSLGKQNLLPSSELKFSLCEIRKRENS